MRGSRRLRDLTGGEEDAGLPDRERDACLEQRDIDVLARAGGGPRVQRRHRGERAIQGADEVANRHPNLDRVTALCPGDAHEAGASLGHDVHPRLVSQRAVLSPSRGGHVNESWVDNAKLLVVEVEVGHGARAQVLDDDVGGRDQLAKDLLAAIRLEVDRDRPLVAVEAHERGALAIDQRRRHAHLVAAVGVFDLDHLGPEVGQLHAAERRRHVVADLEHADAGERRRAIAHRRPPSSPGQATRAPPHRCARQGAAAAIGLGSRHRRASTALPPG